MRLLGFWLLLTALLLAKKGSITDLWKSVETSKKPATTVEKIQDSKQTLKQTSVQQEQMNQLLTKIAKTIARTEKESIALSKALDKLTREKRASEGKYRKAKKQINAHGVKIATLDKDIRQSQEQFVHLLSEQFSIIAAMRKLDRTTMHSAILQEVYEAYQKHNAQKLSTLKSTITTTREQKQKIVTKQNSIKSTIASIVKKRKLYAKKKAQKEKLLAKLAKDENEYRTRLKELMSRQELLRGTLAKLNILRKEEITEQRRREAERRAELKRKTALRQKQRDEHAKERLLALEEGREVKYNFPKTSMTGSVKQYGSSYHRNRVYAYRGSRTISPISNPRLVKKFGTYVDPIYKLKIFNESITLKAPRRDAKVRNILNGKVVFSGQNSMLGKVIVIAHGSKLHTVYAGLSRISPMIKTGSRVKKGAIIGRIKSKLIFQATKDSKYINPVRLIRI